MNLTIFAINDNLFVEGFRRYDVLHPPHELESISVYLLNMAYSGLTNSALLVVLLYKGIHNFIEIEFVNVLHVHVGLFLEWVHFC